MAPQYTRKKGAQQSTEVGRNAARQGNEQYSISSSPTQALASFVGQIATPYLHAASELIYGEPLEAQGAQDTAWAAESGQAQAPPAEGGGEGATLSLPDTVVDDAGYVFRVEGQGAGFVLVTIPEGLPGRIGTQITPEKRDAWEALTFRWFDGAQEIEPTEAAPTLDTAQEVVDDSPSSDSWSSQANDLVNTASEGLAGVQSLMSAGYERFFGPSAATAETAPAQKSASASKNEESLAPEQAEPEQAARQWEDGFDEAAAQAHMRDMFDRYTSIDVGGVTAGTMYRNTSSEEYGGGFHDAVYDGHTSRGDATVEHMNGREADLFRNDRDSYYALLGKGSPEQVEHAVQAAYENGGINGKRPGEGEPLTREEVEAWMKGNVGVDCIGFVMNTLIESPDFSDFGPESEVKRDENYTRLLDLNTHQFDELTTEASGPDQWRAMDVIHWEEDRSGHVMMIYSSEKVSESPSIHELVTQESGASRGVVQRTHYYNADTSQWGTLSGFGPLSDAEREDPAAHLANRWGHTYIQANATVRRVPSGNTEEAAP